MCLAVPGRICEIWSDDLEMLMGRIDIEGVTRTVCLEYVPDIEVGEYAVVHVGFAISRIDEATARDTLDLFREMGILDEELADG